MENSATQLFHIGHEGTLCLSVPTTSPAPARTRSMRLPICHALPCCSEPARDGTSHDLGRYVQPLEAGADQYAEAES